MCVLIEFLLPVVVHVLCMHGFFVITNANNHIYTKYTHGMQLFFFNMLHAWQKSTRKARLDAGLSVKPLGQGRQNKTGTTLIGSVAKVSDTNTCSDLHDLSWVSLN